MKVLDGKVGFVSGTGARGPPVPLVSLRQQASDSIGEFAWIVGIDSQTRLGRIDHLAAGVGIADQTGPTDAHRLEVDEAEPFATARHGKTAATPKQLLFLDIRHAATERYRMGGGTSLRQLFEVLAQVPLSHDA